MVRGRAEAGDGIEVEVWSLPVHGFGAVVARVPAPLAIGTVELADGSRVKGFLCEDHALDPAGRHHRPWRLARLSHQSDGRRLSLTPRPRSAASRARLS